MDKNITDLIYLMSCALNETDPDPKIASDIDIGMLYELCRKHSVSALIYPALEKAGIQSDDFSQAFHKSVRKNILFNIERKAITDEFERQGIWYMPLKGIILKELYPNAGMRQMSDNDILIDPRYRENSRDIMLSRGYKIEHYDTGYCDEYMKPPVLNFEIHIRLFQYESDSIVSKYYENISDKLLSDGVSRCGRRLSDEDLYVYLTAHEYKHYSGGGTGIRSLADCYLFIKSKGDDLDWNYIDLQLSMLGLDQYEKKRREIAMKLFSHADPLHLSNAEEEDVMMYIRYGIYGTSEKKADTQLEKSMSSGQTKLGYILSRAIPKPSYIKEWYPFFRKHPLLLPAGYVLRWIKALTKSRNKVKSEIHALKKHR